MLPKVGKKHQTLFCIGSGPLPRYLSLHFADLKKCISADNIEERRKITFDLEISVAAVGMRLMKELISRQIIK